MRRVLLALAAGACTAFSATGGPPHEAKKTRTVAAQDIAEKLDGKDAKVTVVELVIAPGHAGTPHRHPGPVFGYVLEGEYEWAIDDQPAKVLKAGETFYEPTGCVHRVSKNPAAQGTARVLAVMLHPRDARHIVLPVPKK